MLDYGSLIRCSKKPLKTNDFIIRLIEGSIYVVKRPGVDNFLKYLSNYFEIIIFTRSFNTFKDPALQKIDANNRIINNIDKCGFITSRLFGEHCTNIGGELAKDISKIGRKLEDTLIFDDNCSSFLLQPDNGLPIIEWDSRP